MTKSKGIIQRVKWTQEQVDMLKSRYPDERAADIAETLGMQLRAVYSKAKLLGLSKSETFNQSDASGRTNGKIGKNCRFAKGHKPWNIGTKGLQLGGQATQFKPGHITYTAMQIGSFRLDKSGVLQQKINNNHGNNSVRWRSVHELVWKAQHGDVPANHIVVFKPGMRTNVLEEITIDKVECISFAENMKRNTVHNLPKELVEVVRLRAVVNRKINRMTKDSNYE